MENEIPISIVFSFSGGKDSVLSIYKLLKQNYKIQSLITTITDIYSRVSIHGIREELIMEQANAIGIPLHLIYIPHNCVNEEYERIMLENMSFYKSFGVNYVGFGDIFLEDIRKYREENLKKIGMKCIFPLWKKNTKDLVREFISLKFKSIVVAVDSNLLDISMLGMEFEEFINFLPNNVDVCGENGEFHTFVYDGPIFKKRVNFRKGDIVIKNNYGYIDLYPI
ncbi:MAG: diphthine--ammonia ligase [candidate division WOR-3 bacterium]|nr:diphthine--ammonia ligase [candidate division WOR-3 bacterium]MCX7947553.1 diphthine--ammonia ligase [candidate division WOR-3 bacterium]MDW8150439.1 diphthine--ammonia ligase [candidate division WOR-3 bacterium]